MMVFIQYAMNSYRVSTDGASLDAESDCVL